MISDQEAREAARLMDEALRVRETLAPDSDEMTKAIYAFHSNRDTVLKWATQQLARRKAELAERAKPIDAEWLESLGFKKNEYGYYVKLVANVRVEASVLQSIGRSVVFVGGRHIAWEQEELHL
jgi:hypothetical protein